MKIPQHLLQFGTLALFSSMIGNLVFFRGGIFDDRLSQHNWFSQAQQDSIQPPWFDRVQFEQILRETMADRLASGYTMEDNIVVYGGVPSVQKKKNAKKKPGALNEIDLKSAIQYDTLRSLNVLRTRYEVAHLSKQEARDYKRIFSNFRKEKLTEYHVLPIESDSSLVLSRLRYGPQHFSQLSEQEKTRFKFVLDSLSRPKMLYSGVGPEYFLKAADTTRAIKIVKTEKMPQ